MGFGKRRDREDNLVSMRHGEFGVLLEYPNGNDKLLINYPSLPSEKKSQLGLYMKIKLQTETMKKNKTT